MTKFTVIGTSRENAEQATQNTKDAITNTLNAVSGLVQEGFVDQIALGLEAAGKLSESLELLQQWLEESPEDEEQGEDDET